MSLSLLHTLLGAPRLSERSMLTSGSKTTGSNGELALRNAFFQGASNTFLCSLFQQLLL